jgi:hypothetical protein
LRARLLSIWLKARNSFLQIGFGNADAVVADADFQELLEAVLGKREAALGPGVRDMADRAARHAPRAQADSSALGAELDRIRQQVVRDLLGLAHVEKRHAEIVGSFELELDALCRRLLAHDRQAVRERLRSVTSRAAANTPCRVRCGRRRSWRCRRPRSSRRRVRGRSVRSR